MYTDLTQAVKTAIDNGTRYKCLVFVTGGSFPVTRCLTEANIAEGGFEIERGCTAADRLSFGDVISGVFTLRLIKETLTDFDVNWGSVHLFPFVYPAYADLNNDGIAEEINFTDPLMIDNANQINHLKQCVWGGKDVGTTYKYGRVYGDNTYDQCLIPFQPFYVANVKEDMRYIELTAYDICDTFDSNFVDSYPTRKGYSYFENGNNPEEYSLYYQIFHQSTVEIPKIGLGYYRYNGDYTPYIFRDGLHTPIANYTMRDILGFMAQTVCSNIISARKYMSTIAVSWNSTYNALWSTDTVNTYNVSENKRFSFSSANQTYQYKNIFWNLSYGVNDEVTPFTPVENGRQYSVGFYATDFLSTMLGADYDLYGRVGYKTMLATTRALAGGMNRIAHRPFTATVLGNPCIDPSDRALIDDVTGVSEDPINTPITSVTFRLNSNTEISCCNGSEPTSDTYVPATTSQQSAAMSQTAKETIQTNKKNGSVSGSTITFGDYAKYSLYLIGFEYTYNDTLIAKGNILCHKEIGLSGQTHIRGSVVYPWTDANYKQQFFLFDSHLTDADSGTFNIDTRQRIAGITTYQITITSIQGVI